MSTQINEFQKKNEEVFKQAAEDLNNQKTDTNQIRLKNGEFVDLQFIWNPSKEEEVIRKVQEDKIEFKDNKPVLNEDGTQKKIGSRTRYYCPVMDARDPGVIKIWNASANDFVTQLTPIKELGKTTIRVKRFGEKLDTKYSYIPL